MQLTVDSPAPILALLREVKLRRDPRFTGEIARWCESAGLRCNYFNFRTGLTIDEFGEQLLDRGFILESPRENETIDLLETLFSAVTRKPSSRTVETESNAAAREIEAELDRARRNRHKTYSCPCGESSVKSPKLTLRIRCEGCDARLVRQERSVAEIKLGIPLSAIQGPEYRPPVADSEAAPF